MTNFVDVAAAARFDAARPTKTDLARGANLFIGLNCFEPGQVQAVHRHAGADKVYLVLSGKARIRVGDDARVVGPGMLVTAPADVPHGVEEVLERTTLLIALAPPPAR